MICILIFLWERVVIRYSDHGNHILWTHFNQSKIICFSPQQIQNNTGIKKKWFDIVCSNKGSLQHGPYNLLISYLKPRKDVYLHKILQVKKQEERAWLHCQLPDIYISLYLFTPFQVTSLPYSLLCTLIIIHFSFHQYHISIPPFLLLYNIIYFFNIVITF